MEIYVLILGVIIEVCVVEIIFHVLITYEDIIRNHLWCIFLKVCEETLKYY